ncbi:MAG: cytochrome P450, partial [Acidimicrobiales bacterium]|nr:cytochrome P450 [Acidimicrobiales bacterium]
MSGTASKPSDPIDAVVYNPYSFAVHDDPYVTYKRLRDEAPAYWNDELDFWVLSRFADVLEGFRDYETFSSTGGVALEQRGHVNSDFQQMIEKDPPDHTAFRKLVSRVFTGRRVARMEDEIRRIVNHYIDAVIEQGSCDLVDDITGPFPMDVISAILGIPESDRLDLRLNADKVLIRNDGELAIPPEAGEGMFGLLGYFIEDLPKRKAGRREGLITDLVGLEVDGRSLSDEELLGFCV